MNARTRRGDSVTVPVPMRTVAVIGAGAGGICAAKHLMESGIEVTVFEMGSHIGGLWVYENDSGRSRAYASLHINSEADVTSYPDFPFPDGTPLYPSHGEVAEYLQEYADRFGVTEHIRFNCRVASVDPSVEQFGWQVTLDDGTTHAFDSVVVASGHHRASPPIHRSPTASPGPTSTPTRTESLSRTATRT